MVISLLAHVIYILRDFISWDVALFDIFIEPIFFINGQYFIMINTSIIISYINCKH